MKQAIQQAAKALGYTVLPNWRVEHFAQAEYLKQLFALLQIDCVFDVGANRGQFRDFLRTAVGFSGPIVSFEAVPSLAAELKIRAHSDPKWQIEAYALGRQAGTACFNVMAADQFSSFLKPNHDKVKRFEDSNRVTEEVSVEVKSLAEVGAALLQRFGARNPYLKLDTQGFDLEVVAGAGALLERFPALQTEASVKPIYEGMPDYVSAIRTLGERGFELSGIFPNNAEHFPQLIEFDCHMVSSARLRTLEQ